ncbi:hypothetical protein AMTR_s00066p00166230 [Amborella trichopoda]|uniref:Cytochrome P450 n=1 Tax=Amborella trichopoda TaxID=13333 RepID=U5DFM8_AMBTC|nr:hypothetical protein AMTR_s00066p00166230 [Amborella trichopoda]
MAEVLIGHNASPHPPPSPHFYLILLQVMIVAGTETTAVTLQWALALLLNHPDSLQKAQTKLDQQVGRDRLVEESDLSKGTHPCAWSEPLRFIGSGVDVTGQDLRVISFGSGRGGGAVLEWAWR